MTERNKIVEDYLAREVKPYVQPCLDSSVFCAGLNEEIYNWVKRKEVFDWIWANAENKKYQIWISVITIVEVHKLRRRKNNEVKVIKGPLYDEFLKKIEEGVKQKFVKIIDLGQTIADAAHNLCCTMDISPNDAIILASALEWECDTVLAWDGDLSKKTHNKIRLEEPFIYERDMFNTTIEIATEQEQDDYDRDHKVGAYAPSKVLSIAAPVEAQAPDEEGAKESKAESK